MQVSTTPEPKIVYSTAFTTTYTCSFLTVAEILFNLKYFQSNFEEQKNGQKNWPDVNPDDTLQMVLSLPLYSQLVYS